MLLLIPVEFLPPLIAEEVILVEEQDRPAQDHEVLRILERLGLADLEDPAKRHLSISEIAFDHGFGNISSFNRAFKSRFHTTPQALRSVR
jgi:AraC-like DNA-binding protein